MGPCHWALGQGCVGRSPSPSENDPCNHSAGECGIRGGKPRMLMAKGSGRPQFERSHQEEGQGEETSLPFRESGHHHRSHWGQVSIWRGCD